MNISDVMLHVNEFLSPETRHALEEEMREVDGVISPGFSPLMKTTCWKSHTTTDVVAAIDLLHKVESHGYHAQLVGL